MAEKFALNTLPDDKQLLAQIALESIKEQKRRRRWGIFFKLAFLLYLVVFLLMLWSPTDLAYDGNKPHTALIEIDGPIFEGAQASADNVARSLDAAFKDKGTKGVILRIDSPGGSPVQADYIFKEIKRQRSINPEVKVYAVCVDICASGAYYIAAAADEIYANPASLVGSIGVIMNGFGFVDTMNKLGVSRRLVTAGSHKGFLDPFSPLKPDEQIKAQQLLDQVHDQFIARVKQGRGQRLKINEDTFSGLVWTGEQAKSMGLIDGFYSSGEVAREVIKQKDIINYTIRPSYFERLSQYMGASFGKEITSEFKTRIQ